MVCARTREERLKSEKNWEISLKSRWDWAMESFESWFIFLDHGQSLLSMEMTKARCGFRKMTWGAAGGLIGGR